MSGPTLRGREAGRGLGAVRMLLYVWAMLGGRNEHEAVVCALSHLYHHAQRSRYTQERLRTKNALPMFRTEVSCVPPTWIDMGPLEEQSGRRRRWCMRHILMTNGHNTFFSQSRQGLLKALRTMVLQPKLADVSFTFFSTPKKNDT